VSIYGTVVTDSLRYVVVSVATGGAVTTAGRSVVVTDLLYVLYDDESDPPLSVGLFSFSDREVSLVVID